MQSFFWVLLSVLTPPLIALGANYRYAPDDEAALRKDEVSSQATEEDSSSDRNPANETDEPRPSEEVWSRQFRDDVRGYQK